MGEYFSIITMKTKTGKILYAKAGHGKSIEWTFDKKDAIWFQSEADAKNFCKEYFKNFKDYEIQNIEMYV